MLNKEIVRPSKHGQYYVDGSCCDFLSSKSLVLPALQNIRDARKAREKRACFFGSEVFSDALDEAVNSLDLLLGVDIDGFVSDEVYQALFILKDLKKNAYN